MAKLTAHGGVIVARAVRERQVTDSDLIVWERERRAVRREASGTLRTLSGHDCRFTPDRYDPEGRYHSWGWQVRGKLKAGVTVEQWIEAYTRLGWTVTRE
jgi:hypothetical protein